MYDHRKFRLIRVTDWQSGWGKKATTNQARRYERTEVAREVAQGLDDHADDIYDWESGNDFYPVVWDSETSRLVRDDAADCLCHHPWVEREPMTYSTAKP